MLQVTRDAIMNFLGDRNDDEALALMETVDNEGVESENWKEKYEQNDREWREKYASRFKSAPVPTSNTDGKDDLTKEIEAEERNEKLNLNDILFGKED